GMPIDFKILAAAEDVFAHKAPGARIGNRLTHDVNQVTIFATDVHVANFCSHGQPGDDYTFNHSMRIVLQDQAVFAGAGLGFVSVDQDVFRLVRLFGNKAPLHARGEAGSAATAQV